MEKIDVAALDVSGKIEKIHHILDNMHARSSGLGHSGFLLGGDTGVGKTSFVRDLAALLGMELIIIETPHIVEEHIIDIPFIVISPTGQQKMSALQVDVKSAGTHDFDIKFAKSNLYMALVKAIKATDSQLLKNVSARNELKLIWEKLGGTDTKVPSEIADIRKKYKCILFLDEYFRQTSSSIRNMLRSILNGRIGNNPLPDDVYVIYASNLVDQGVGEVLENEDFNLINFDQPSLDEWFAYMLTKYKNHSKVKLDEGLVKKFYELLQKHEGSLSLDDIAADVRVSPRRWEQLLVYISSALPVKNKKDADLLLKNVEVNFRHYQTGEKAAIADDVLTAVKELIKETSNIEASEKNVDDADWRDTLKHQLETRIKAGDTRKYIPVIGGLPGSGKTTYITHLATDLNLVPVFVEVHLLSPEDTIGTPVAKSGDDDELDVKFSRPPLWDSIMKQIKDGEKNLEARLKKFFSPEEAERRLKAFKNQDVKYLIFFDELNRTNTKVFNAIRKVLLEKEFSPEYKLPKEAIMVAAINPTGKGTQELTKHVRDVFDVIPVGISWSKFRNHLNSLDLGVSDETRQLVLSALDAFVNHFRVKQAERIEGADPHFWLNLGSTPIYISAREYTDLVVNGARALERALRAEMARFGDPDHDMGESEMKVRTALYRSFEHKLGAVLFKHGFEAPEFMSDLKDWMLHTDQINFGSIFKKKVQSIQSLPEILMRVFKDPTENLMDDPEFINYISSVDPVVFNEELQEFADKVLTLDPKKSFEATKPMKSLEGGKIKIDKTKKVSEIEYIMREIANAVKAHDVSNEIVNSTTSVIQKILMKLLKVHKANVSEVMALSTAMGSYIKKLFSSKT